MNISNTVKYPLHLAVTLNDLPALQGLLGGVTPYDINAVDDLNFTPLHIAALTGNLEIVVFLLSKGADPTLKNGYDQNLSALDLAASQGDYEIVSLLVEDQPTTILDNMNLEHAMICSLDMLCLTLDYAEYYPWDFDDHIDVFSTLAEAQAQTGNPFLFDLSCELPLFYPTETCLEPMSVWLEALTAYAPNKEIYNLLMEQVDYINEHDSNYEAYIDAKCLLHVLPVDRGEYTISYQSALGETLSNINCHGSMLWYMAPFVAKEIEAYKASLDPFVNSDYKIFAELSEIYQHSALLAKQPFIFENSVLAYQWYQDGQTVLIPTGWEGHAVNIILDPLTETLTVANAGYRYSELLPGAHIYQMHAPYELNPELIFDILNNTEQCNLELGIKYELALDEVAYLAHPDQLYGNCGWYSHKPTIETLLYLHHIHEGETSEVAQTQAHTQYINWENFEMQHALEEYFDNRPALSIDVVLDILVDYHPSLFLGSEAVNPIEYNRAAYLTKVLASDAYHDDFREHISADLLHAKPELIELFLSVDLLTPSDMELAPPPCMPPNVFEEVVVPAF